MKTVKLSFTQLVLLHDAHANKVQLGTGPYYELLQEHCADFCLLFDRLMEKGSLSCKVKFTSLQALAFMQLWIDQPLPANNGAYVILDMLGQFDKANKQVRAIL